MCLLAFAPSGCEQPKPLPPPAPVEPPPAAPRVEIKDGLLHVDGERFIVRGIGYEPGALPGKYPKKRKPEPEILKQDLQRIKDAGFNTVRSWDGYTDDELTAIEKEGLFAIQGIEVHWPTNVEDPAYISRSLAHVDRVVKSGSKHANILMYLVMNEPNTETILRATEPKFIEFMTQLRDRVHEKHPGVPVSFANTCIGEFLDPSIWDAVAFNLYMYNPVTVKEILGYRGYLEWLRKKSPSVPLVVTEFGLSVSPGGEGRFGYGGNSLQDQTEGDLWMLQSLLQAGAQGSCVFSYSDGWWKNGNVANDAETHDDEAEEWYGLVGYASKEDMEGTPRPAWEAFSRANRALWIEPASWKEYKEKIPVEVYSTSDVHSMAVQTASGLLIELRHEGKNWWRGEIPAEGLGATESLVLIARSGQDEKQWLRQQRTIVTDWSKVPAELRPVSFSVEQAPQSMSPGERIPVLVKAHSAAGAPVADRAFQIGYYPHDGWAPGRTYEARSDADGRIHLDLDSMPKPGVITLSIGTGHEPLKDTPTWGSAFILRVK
jgi:hypothetical protein